MSALPSEEERAERVMEKLAEEGCRNCGEHDPEQLERTSYSIPKCPHVERPREAPPILCESCQETQPNTYRERMIKKARNQNETLDSKKVVGITFYECGNIKFVTAEKVNEYNGESIYEDESRRHWQPTAALQCRCGATIDEYVPFSELSSE